MKIILLLCFLLFTTANMDIIATGGIGVILLSLVPLQGGVPFPLDMLEDDVGLLPTRRSPSLNEETTRAPDWETKLKMSYRECQKVTGISGALVKQFRSGTWKSGHQIRDWTLCVLNRMDLMTLQGVFRYDTALDYIHRDIGYGAKEITKASLMINKCLTDKLLTPDQIAWEYLQCLRRKDSNKKYPSLGILQPADLKHTTFNAPEERTAIKSIRHWEYFRRRI